ncbi:uncharacterized protein C8Q71DRAFT_855462 [Rhodofomes roseus]|uniref:Uncharacterized protein n=1 Tax=Rhodofomes roseus TaxID=34475 RepID=A0ABQ8KP64_9APHY|nr:uncharacterized protein C8Q71DRAFT_855462 [Rhodofomes roseus]KAH9840179.1 hypothetical protein C8Q71DRAFT_855462 [Rhodofomes roseus]
MAAQHGYFHPPHFCNLARSLFGAEAKLGRAISPGWANENNINEGCKKGTDPARRTPPPPPAASESTRECSFAAAAANASSDVLLCSHADSEPDALAALLLSRLFSIACTCALRLGWLDMGMTPAGQLRFDKLSTLVRIAWVRRLRALCAFRPRVDKHARNIFLDRFLCGTPHDTDMTKAVSGVDK